MGANDKRNRFADEVFAYRAAKEGAAFISWQGKMVTTLRGRSAERFLEKIAGSSPEKPNS